jgi:hypothetical protein
MKRLLACLAVAAAASGPAAACVNDRELPAHEREFRSQYRTPVAAQPAAASAEEPRQTALYSVGGVLLASALGLTVTRRGGA